MLDFRIDNLIYLKIINFLVNIAFFRCLRRVVDLVNFIILNGAKINGLLTFEAASRFWIRAGILTFLVWRILQKVCTVNNFFLLSFLLLPILNLIDIIVVLVLHVYRILISINTAGGVTWCNWILWKLRLIIVISNFINLGIVIGNLISFVKETVSSFLSITGHSRWVLTFSIARI